MSAFAELTSPAIVASFSWSMRSRTETRLIVLRTGAEACRRVYRVERSLEEDTFIASNGDRPTDDDERRSIEISTHTIQDTRILGLHFSFAVQDDHFTALLEMVDRSEGRTLLYAEWQEYLVKCRLLLCHLRTSRFRLLRHFRDCRSFSGLLLWCKVPKQASFGLLITL
jgi:hypothetical protein